MLWALDNQDSSEYNSHFPPALTGSGSLDSPEVIIILDDGVSNLNAVHTSVSEGLLEKDWSQPFLLTINFENILKDISKYPDRGFRQRSPADRADRIGPRSGWVWDSLGRSTAIKTKLCHNSGSRRNDFIKLSPHSKPLLPPSCSPSPCSSPIWPPDPEGRSSEPIWKKLKKNLLKIFILCHRSPPGIGHNHPIVDGKVILWKAGYLPLTDLDLMWSQYWHHIMCLDMGQWGTFSIDNIYRHGQINSLFTFSWP